MKCFAKIVSWLNTVNIFAKSSTLDDSLGFEYASDYPLIIPFLLLLTEASTLNIS